jgi:release factor glutamine methyltransferase
LLIEAAARLASAGIESPEREARLLQRYFPEAADFAAALARRVAREPMSHILGRREFWSLEFAVTSAVLDPRPDSETLVEAVLAALPERTRPYRLLDLGTGSGCLLLALLSELPHATGLGIDASAAALDVARANAARLGLADRARFAPGDWAQGLDGLFDVIVANPPYIPTAEIAALQPEVALWEPRAALDGGPDGLAAYRTLVPALPRHLAEEGLAAIEIGADQAAAVGEIARESGLDAAIRRDLAGHDRCLILRKSKKNIGNLSIRY